MPSICPTRVQLQSLWSPEEWRKLPRSSGRHLVSRSCSEQRNRVCGSRDELPPGTDLQTPTSRSFSSLAGASSSRWWRPVRMVRYFVKCSIDKSSCDLRNYEVHYLLGYEAMSCGRISPSFRRTFAVTIFTRGDVLNIQWTRSKHCLWCTRSWIWRYVFSFAKLQRNSIFKAFLLYVCSIWTLICNKFKLNVIVLLKVVYPVIRIKSDYL